MTTVSNTYNFMASYFQNELMQKFTRKLKICQTLDRSDCIQQTKGELLLEKSIHAKAAGNTRTTDAREEIAFTAQPKIHSHSQIFKYGRRIFCLPHRPNFSDIFDLCLHWVSVVRVTSDILFKLP